MVALALLTGKAAEAKRLAVAGTAAGAWGWPSAIWLTAVMEVVEGAIAGAADEADIIDEEEA